MPISTNESFKCTSYLKVKYHVLCLCQLSGALVVFFFCDENMAVLGCFLFFEQAPVGAQLRREEETEGAGQRLAKSDHSNWEEIAQAVREKRLA